MGKMGKDYSLCLLHIRVARVPISSLFLTRREGGTYDRTLDLTTRILSLHTTNLGMTTTLRLEPSSQRKARRRNDRCRRLSCSSTCSLRRC